MLENFDAHDVVDLSATTVWCRTPLATQQLYRSLQREAQAKNISGLLPPEIMPLRQWLSKQFDLKQPLLCDTMKQLVIAESVREHQSFFGHFSPWEIANELRDLFDGLLLAGQGAALDSNFDQTIRRAYGNATLPHSCCSRESQVVLHLWEQWHQYVKDSEYIDPIAAYNIALSSVNIASYSTFYLFDYPRFSYFEKQFLHQLISAEKLRFYSYEHPASKDVHLNHHPGRLFIETAVQMNQQDNAPADHQNLFDLAYDSSIPLAQRSQQLNQQFPDNPFSRRMKLLITDHLETHAQAIVLQSRLWLLETNATPVGIVCNDRQLARRLRALFERAAIEVSDYGGWALSTTSAAAFVELWLDYMESEQQFRDLQRLLSSPFARSPLFTLNEQIDYYRWLKGFFKHPNESVTNATIAGQLESDSTTVDEHALHYFTDLIEQARIGRELITQQEISLQAATRFLLESLKQLNIYDNLEADAAGSVLIALLSNSLESISAYPLQVNWTEWRSWLRQLMENEYFIPHSSDNRVMLCNLEQAIHLDLSYVIIAGCEEQRLIGKPPDYTFFNDRVRKEIGLSHWQESKSIRYSCFRQLIGQSQSLLFTAEQSIGGQPAPLASWIEQLRVLSVVCYQEDLLNEQLMEMIDDPNAQVQPILTHHELPENYQQPAHLQPTDVPTLFSASMYQTLLDCPYRYFARYILELSAPSSEEDWDASRFGKIIHNILYLFHFDRSTSRKDTAEYSRYTLAHRNTLIEELTELSYRQFQASPTSDLLSRAWLSRWEKQIPSYVDWCIQNMQSIIPDAGEKSYKTSINGVIELQGQIDRIDRHADHYQVVDYKTGSRIPSKKQVLNGEQIQLLCYAKLCANTSAAYYLDLNQREDVRQQALIEGETLKQLCDENIDRLMSIVQMLLNGSDLPAWGEQALCDYCEYEGVCRKPQLLHMHQSQ